MFQLLLSVLIRARFTLLLSKFLPKVIRQHKPDNKTNDSADSCPEATKKYDESSERIGFDRFLFHWQLKSVARELNLILNINLHPQLRLVFVLTLVENVLPILVLMVNSVKSVDMVLIVAKENQKCVDPE